MLAPIACNMNNFSIDFYNLVLASEGSDWAKVGSEASDWPSAVPLPPSSTGGTMASRQLDTNCTRETGLLRIAIYPYFRCVYSHLVLVLSEWWFIWHCLIVHAENEIDLDALQLMSKKEFTEIGLPTVS
jgi:hypothetical protein